MKRISLETILKKYSADTYQEQYQQILKLIEDGAIRPVKASGVNGKKPALYREYWILEEKPDYSVWLEELKYGLHPAISVDYYLAHPETYLSERWAVIRLSRYLKEQEEKTGYQVSVNERSFEIWGQEKFLKKGECGKILKHCGLDPDDLNIYDTTEPLAYYCHTRKVPQNLLILENKDTFFSMRKYLLDGGTAILGVPVGTLIYGAGKGILKSFRDFDLCAEPYMRAQGNTIYYFGDLDYEGIRIFESLARTFEERWKVVPLEPAYRVMLEKAGRAESLPKTKEHQNRNIKELFFSYFSEDQVREMKTILETDRYVPQEILNITDL